MNQLHIESKHFIYNVTFTDNFNFIQDLVKIEHFVIIVDSNVYDLYKKTIFDLFPSKKIIIIIFTEQKKTLQTVTAIYKKLLTLVAKKNLTIISFGGGITQDVVGFTASTLYRGVKWIYIPTTLLAMADSAIGLKTSLNFSSYKNVIGTFYAPSKIFILPQFIQTLKKEDFYSGIGEIIKLLLMQENAPSQFDRIIRDIALLHTKDEKHILRTMQEVIKIKLSYMEGDEFDTGKRNVLNYGHEFGHALEPASSFAIPHGIAVLIGIIFANAVAVNRGWLDRKMFDFLNDNLLLVNIPRDVIKLEKEYFNPETLLKNMKNDKKKISNDLPLVLPKENFTLHKITDLKKEEFYQGLSDVETVLGI